MSFRISQKLNTKNQAGKLVEMPPDENPYASWSCHLVRHVLTGNYRRQYIHWPRCGYVSGIYGG